MGSKLTSQEAREDGLAAQKIVEKWLADNGYDVRAASNSEDLYHDIDFWIVNEEGQWKSVSVKANEPEYFEAPFVFELFTCWNRDKGRVQTSSSWYFNGKADYYLIFKRDTYTTGRLWLMSRQEVHAYVDTFDFDTITRVKGNARKREIEEGKVFTEVGLIRQEKLTAEGVAKLIGVIK